MIVKHLFFSLMERLDSIEQAWSDGLTEDRRQKLIREMAELRQMSDTILDHWLLFEERIAKLQQRIQPDQEEVELDRLEQELEQIPDEVAEKILQEVKQLAQTSPKSKSHELVTFLSGEVAHAFRKGQGYYSLFMFPEAAEHFRQVIDQDPDLEIARLFLAFSEMLKGDFQEADRQFHLLSSTTGHRLLQAVALNAQGCLHAVQEQWDQALYHFEKAARAYPKLKESLFNKGLVLMKQGDYREAKQVWLACRKENPQDWEVLLMLARCSLEEGRPDEAESVLVRLIQASREPEILFQAGQMFENLGQFGNASLCYRILLQEDPDNPAAWHGLGWNLWHAEGSPWSIHYIQKAIALSPQNPDFRFSYGWILYQLKEYEEAEQIFTHILQQEGFYPLAIAGLVHVHMAKVQWLEAQECCLRLINEPHAQTKALGHLHMGIVCLARLDYEKARQHLEQSIQFAPDMRDSHLLLGLVRHLQGDKEEALKIWERML